MPKRRHHRQIKSFWEWLMNPLEERRSHSMRRQNRPPPVQKDGSAEVVRRNPAPARKSGPWQLEQRIAIPKLEGIISAEDSSDLDSQRDMPVFTGDSGVENPLLCPECRARAPVALRGPPLQRIGLAVEGSGGIFERQLRIELNTNLLLGLLSIALAPPLGIVCRLPFVWTMGAVVGGMGALFWEELAAPVFLARAHRLLLASQTPTRWSPGSSALVRLRRWARRTLELGGSHLLHWLGSSTWLVMTILLCLAPVTTGMFNYKLNMQQLLQFANWICRVAVL